MGWGETFEDELLAAITVDGCLNALSDPDRVLIEMVFGLVRPVTYTGPWPANYSDIGRYVGITYTGQPLSEATVRHRRKGILSFLRGERPPMVLRRDLKKPGKIARTSSRTPKKRPTVSEVPAISRPDNMDNELYEKVYLPKYLDVIEALAQKLAPSDPDLFEDLKQTGMIALWQVDLTKALKNEDAYIRQILRNRMIQHLRYLKPSSYTSLQVLLNDDGNQIVKDDSTGRAAFVEGFLGRRNYLESDEEQSD